MQISYILGVLFALSSGTLSAISSIMQKICVNRLPMEYTDDKILKNVAKQPLWILSLVLSVGFGTVCNLIAQNYIGPSLTPGLQAIGLIVLALGSFIFIGEHLRVSEIIGIFIIIGGIFCLGASQLGIPSSEVNINENALLFRIFLFTLIVILLWISTFTIAKKGKFPSQSRRGIILAISAGFPFCISNLWISPLLATIGLVFGGIANGREIIVFIIACFLLPFNLYLGIHQNQLALKNADASKVQPILSLPREVSQIFIYFTVFMKVAPLELSILMLIGVILIISGGFLLGKQKAVLK
jgi:drug/metabolite transporter (DMT)-like permease